MKSEVALVSWSRWKPSDSSSPRLRLQGVPAESAAQTQGRHHRGGAETDGRRAPPGGRVAPSGSAGPGPPQGSDPQGTAVCAALSRGGFLQPPRPGGCCCSPPPSLCHLHRGRCHTDSQCSTSFHRPSRPPWGQIHLPAQPQPWLGTSCHCHCLGPPPPLPRQRLRPPLPPSQGPGPPPPPWSQPGPPPRSSHSHRPPQHRRALLLDESMSCLQIRS
uniref:Uncharacterized protein isoform X1 n=1 Tax=Sus scrofa TaxID=9823 RepID=A0A480GNQ8_PIG